MEGELQRQPLEQEQGKVSGPVKQAQFGRGTTERVPNGGRVKRAKSMVREGSPHILQMAAEGGGGGRAGAGNILAA